MIEIQNTQECFVLLWRKLERTRRLLHGQCKRFCVRRVLKTWFGPEATDDFIWEVCHAASLALQHDDPEADDVSIYGWDELPLPSLYPRRHRELLRAIVSVRLGIGMRKVDLHALDAAYTVAFPGSTPLNVNKKKRSLTP